ncbi:hypothetical protein GQ457_16G022570 [Hibiscus cannabinus]
MSLFEVIHMIESLGIKSVVKVFRAVPNGAFKVLPLTDDNDVLNMVVELPRNRNVHMYLVEQDHAFVSEPNDEHEPQTNDEPQLIDSDSEFGTEPNIEINVESRTDPNDEPVGRDTEFGIEPNTNAESETDPNDETVGSDTESETKCESDFEEDDFSVDEEDDSETESVVHTPQFIEHSTQFETHFEEARVVSDNETEYSDSLHSVDESDSEHSCRKKRFPEFNTQTDMVHPMLKVGMIFANREVLKKAVINYGLQNSCNTDYGKINMSSRTIAEKYLHFFVSDRNFSIYSLHEVVKKDFISPVHQSKLYRARDIAIEIIEGKHKDQYSRTYDYLGELRLSNPGTTTICKLDERVFERLYICMQACKDGFKAGCRPIICLDGCHLKGYHGGHLLNAIGIVANDCIYPIAFVAVESECHSSWCWFVQLLEEDLDFNNSYHISFMSDRQKILCVWGLKEALSEYFPYFEHRFCVRHLYNNFKENIRERH